MAQERPVDLKSLIAQGVALHQARQFDRAEAHCRQLLAVHADHPLAFVLHYNLARALDDLGRGNEAVQAYDAALARRPGLLQALDYKGRSLLVQDQPAEALTCFDAALAQSSEDAGLHRRRGLCLQALGRLDEAAAALHRAIALKPAIESYADLGAIYLEQGNLERAIDAYGQVADRKPQVTEAPADLPPARTEALNRRSADFAAQRQRGELRTLRVPHLEMDLAHLCNLHCDGCTHYSNYTLKGIVDYDTGSVWLRQWAERITPDWFAFLGGEPTLNPRLTDYIRLAAELWPATTRVLVSNGFFLDRHPDLFAVMAETGTRLDISVHSQDVDYVQRLTPQFLRIMAAKRDLGLSVIFRNSLEFYRSYRGHSQGMRPYNDGKPRHSWTVCRNKHCKTLHQGKLWKCPPIAFLGLVADKFALDRVDEWQPYLAYDGIEPTIDDAGLADFFLREEEAICAMCPSRLEWHKKTTT